MAIKYFVKLKISAYILRISHGFFLYVELLVDISIVMVKYLQVI